MASPQHPVAEQGGAGDEAGDVQHADILGGRSGRERINKSLHQNKFKK